MKILSLFDGMACGMLAFQAAEIPVEEYYAYEIDEYAIQTATHNFPNIKELGDVFNADFTKYEGIDFLIGGSPCTYWSIAQSPDKRETTASGMGWELFSQYVRALHEAKPKYFLYENNKSMAKAIYQSISEAFGFEPILINSALVSAQNRQRYYWVGKREPDGTYSKVDIQQPEDRGILLKDILESGQRVMCAEPVCVAQRGRYTDTGNRHRKTDAPTEQHYEARPDGKTNALTTVQKDNGVAEPVNITVAGKSQTIKHQYGNNSIANFCRYTSTYGASGVAEPVRVGSLPRPNGELSTSQSLRVYDVMGKSVNITANGGGAGAKSGLYAIPVEFDGDIPTKAISAADGKIYTVYRVHDGKITIKEKEYPIKLTDGYYIIRKLTVRECMRLQTVPEWYEFPVSNKQAYQMLGNGWTVDVIAHILKGVTDA